MTTLGTAGVAGAGSVEAPVPARRDRRGAGAWRMVVLAVLGLYFVVPIGASVLFTVRGPGGRGVTAEYYTGIPTAPGFAEAFSRSLALGVLTVALALLLMLPTVVLVNLRLPRLRTTVEMLTLLPLVLPPIALVVGVRSVLAWAPDYFLGTPLAEAFFALQEPELPWILVLVYVVLALPFVYRALDAGLRGVDLRTLTEAARNLGASRPRVLVEIVLPQVGQTLLVGLVLSFVTMLSVLSVPMMVAGSQPTMLTVDMAFRINSYGDYATANALGVISYAMTAVVAWIYLRHQIKRDAAA